MHQSSGDDSVFSQRSARIQPMCAKAAFGLLNATWMADCTAPARSAMIITIGTCIVIITGAVIGSVASAPTNGAFEEGKLYVAGPLRNSGPSALRFDPGGALEKRKGARGLPLHVRRLICLWEQRARCPRAVPEVSEGEKASMETLSNPDARGAIQGTPAGWFAEPLCCSTASPGLEGRPTPFAGAARIGGAAPVDHGLALPFSGALALPLGAPIGVTVGPRFSPRSGPISMAS